MYDQYDEAGVKSAVGGGHIQDTQMDHFCSI
jgi:hypothetical protein